MYLKDGIKTSPVNPLELARKLPLPKETKLQQLSSSERTDTCQRNGNRDWNRTHCGPGDGGKFFFFGRRSIQKFGEISIYSQLMEWHAVKGDDFIRNIFTGDARWFHHFATETRQSVEWHLTISPKKKWTKTRSSAARARRSIFEKLKGAYWLSFATREHHKCCSLPSYILTSSCRQGKLNYNKFIK